MCGKKLKIFLSLSVLLLSLSFSPSSAHLCAEVVLTDEEAQEMMNEIQISIAELNTLTEQLEKAENQLKDVRNIYEEQKKSYEMQLNEAEEKTAKYKTLSTVSTTTAGVLAVVTLLLLVF